MCNDDTRLLVDAVAGDRNALAELLKRHGPGLRRRLASQIAAPYRSVLDPDDVLQVTYLEAFLRIKDLNPQGIEAFSSWLGTIAEHNLLDGVRQLSRKKRPPRRQRVERVVAGDSYVSLMALLGASLPLPIQEAALREAKEVIDGGLRRLPSDYRQVLLLYYFEGLAAADVAHRMNRSLGAVFMLKARAIEHLRGKLPGESAFFTESQ